MLKYKRKILSCVGKIRERFAGSGQVHEYGCQYGLDRETGENKITGMKLLRSELMWLIIHSVVLACDWPE